MLTRQLLEVGARVLALEIDLAWAVALAAQPSTREARLIVADGTQWPWSRLPPATLVSGNLPFNVGTVLVEQVVHHWRQVSRAAFLVQKEVGDRLVARPGEEAYGALSVLTAARARVTKLGRVSRGSFRPPPKVDGAFVGLELTEPVLAEESMGEFTATVRLAFSQRRKQLRNALAAGWGREAAHDTLRMAGIDPRYRAEQLSLEEFLKLHEARLAVQTQRLDEDRSASLSPDD